MTEHYKQKYTTQEVGRITPYLRQLDQAAHAGVFGQGLIEIYKGTGKLNLQEIEKLLRQERCRTHLIGLGITNEIDTNYDIFMPGTDRRFPYWLWTEVNWERQALAKLQEERINVEENLTRLADTGLLAVKPGTQLARALKADLN